MVFQGVVKIRKGQAVTLMMEATNMRAVQNIITQYSQEVGCVVVSVFPAFTTSTFFNAVGLVLSLCRFYRRSPSPIRHGTRPCTSWP